MVEVLDFLLDNPQLPQNNLSNIIIKLKCLQKALRQSVHKAQQFSKLMLMKALKLFTINF